MSERQVGRRGAARGLAFSWLTGRLIGVSATRMVGILCAACIALASPASADEDARISELESKVEILSQEIERLRKEEEKKSEEASETQTASEAPAEDADAKAEADSETEEKVNILAREVDRLKRAVAVPENEELRSVYGMGPGASKVYLKERGLSLGGYGEANFSAIVGDKDGRDNISDALRAVIYLGYKFNDWIVFNSEYEFEHAISSGNGSVGVEFMTLDFLLHEMANVKVGLVLTPMGFINEIHEPVYFYGVDRPSPELTIIPTTWREIGTGLFGNLGTETLTYKIYAMTGLNAEGFSSSGVRGGRQKGSKALANDWAVTARLDWEPTPGLLFGGSLWSGASGQKQFAFDVWTTIWELHAQWKWQGLHTRALFTMSHIGDAGDLTDQLLMDRCDGTQGAPADETCRVAERMLGGYVEIAYDVLPHFFPDTEMRLEPFYRWEISDTQNKMPAGVPKYGYADFQTHLVGLQYYPHPQVVIKANYRNVSAKSRDTKGRARPDDFQLGIGFVF